MIHRQIHNFIEVDRSLLELAQKQIVVITSYLQACWHFHLSNTKEFPTRIWPIQHCIAKTIELLGGQSHVQELRHMGHSTHT